MFIFNIEIVSNRGFRITEQSPLQPLPSLTTLAQTITEIVSQNLPCIELPLSFPLPQTSSSLTLCSYFLSNTLNTRGPLPPSEKSAYLVISSYLNFFKQKLLKESTSTSVLQPSSPKIPSLRKPIGQQEPSPENLLPLQPVTGLLKDALKRKQSSSRISPLKEIGPSPHKQIALSSSDTPTTIAIEEADICSDHEDDIIHTPPLEIDLSAIQARSNTGQQPEKSSKTKASHLSEEPLLNISSQEALHIINGSKFFIIPVFEIHKTSTYRVCYSAKQKQQSLSHVQYGIRCNIKQNVKKIEAIINQPIKLIYIDPTTQKKHETTDPKTAFYILLQGLKTAQKYYLKHHEEILSDRTCIKAGELLQLSITMLENKLATIETPISSPPLLLEAMDQAIQNKKDKLAEITFFTTDIVPQKLVTPFIIIFSIRNIHITTSYEIWYHKYNGQDRHQLFIDSRKSLYKTLAHLPKLLETPMPKVVDTTKNKHQIIQSSLELYRRLWEGLEETRVYCEAHAKQVIKNTKTYPVHTNLITALANLASKITPTPTPKTESSIIADLMKKETSQHAESDSDDDMKD